MSKGKTKPVSNAVRLLVLAMIASLAVLPLYGNYAMASAGYMASTNYNAEPCHQHDMASAHTNYDELDITIEVLTDSTDTIAASVDHQHHCNGNDCKAYCGALSLMVEPVSVSYFQSCTIYDMDRDSAVFAGEYPVPHRPPNT